MKRCPICNREFERLLAVSRTHKEKTLICDECSTRQALDVAVEAGSLKRETAEAILQETIRQKEEFYK